MNSRQRVITALNHQEPDRIPIDFGSTSVSGIAATVYRELKKHLNIDGPVQAMVGHQLAYMEESVQEYFQSDTRRAGPLPQAWKEWTFPDGNTFYIDESTQIEHQPDGSDIWSASCEVKMQMPKNGWFFDYLPEFQPLSSDNVTPADVEHFFSKLPTLPTDLKDTIVADIRRLQLEGKYAVVADMPTAVFECWNTRGFEQFLFDLAADPELASAFMNIHADFWLDFWRPVYEEASDALDVVFVSDDLGAQTGPIISMKTYECLVKPVQKRVWGELKRLCPNARLMVHSDGRIDSFLPHFIEMGVDIINPLQYTAEGMGVEKIKREFGRDLTIWGGGCDTQNILTRFTPEQVRKETRRNIETLASGGGYIFSAVHDIQPGTPIENVFALFETAHEYGVY